MYLYGSIEQVGTGTEMIVEKCIARGLRSPDFKQDTDFITTFWRNEENKYKYKINTEKYIIKENKKIYSAEKKNLAEKGTERITKNQKLILENVNNNQYITIDELVVGISASKIKENIAKLKAKGLLERIGPDKGGHWKVIQDIKR
jgi:ATP-dependent DNA helicase RecG